MPISNGSNNWPKTYWSRPPKRPGVHSRVIVVDRPDPPDVKGPSVPSSPQVTYRSPSPQYDYPRTPSPPPSPSTRRTIVEERIRYDDPPPRKIRVEDPPMTPPPPPHVNRSITTTRTQFDRQPQPPMPPPSRVMSTRSTRYGRYGPDSVRSTGYDRYQTGYNYSSQRETSSGCCGNHLFNSGKAGGDTGCCQGGLFSNKRYPYGAEDYYQMPGDGRHRCCAMIWGIIAGLLLLGLLIGLLAGLLPALQKQNAQTAIASKYPNGKMYNGIYYYPVTNPPDVFYLALGPGIPCNQFNNNSATKAPAATATKNTATVTGTPKTAAPVTTRTTLPDCKSVTTAYVQVAGRSVSTTTVSWAQQFPNGAATTPRTSSSFCRLGVLAAVVVGYTLSGRY